MKASVSRRHFLQGATALSASGLVLGLTPSGSLAAMQDKMQEAALTNALAVYGQRVTMLPMTANGVDFG